MMPHSFIEAQAAYVKVLSFLISLPRWRSVVVARQAGSEFFRQRQGFQYHFLFGNRSLDVVLTKKFVDMVVDVTADLRVTPRLVRPDEQPKIERVVAKLHELHARRRIFQHELHALRRFDQSFSDVVDVGIVRDADGNRDARARIRVRPVNDALTDEFRVGNDDRDAIVRGNYRRAQIDTLDVAFVLANRDPVTDANRPLKQQDETGSDVGGQILESETDADGQRGEDDGERREVDLEHRLQCQQYADGDDEVTGQPADRVTQSRIDMRLPLQSFFD